MVETAFVYGRACPDMHPGKSVVVLLGEKRRLAHGFSEADSLEASRANNELVIDANADVVAVADVVVHEGRGSRLGDDQSMDQRCVWMDAIVGGLDIVDIVDCNIVDHNTVDRSTEDGVADGVEKGVVDGGVEVVQIDTVAVAVGVMVLMVLMVAAVDVVCVPLDRDPWLWLDII